jgi:hypothetical protein
VGVLNLAATWYRLKCQSEWGKPLCLAITITFGDQIITSPSLAFPNSHGKTCEKKLAVGVINSASIVANKRLDQSSHSIMSLRFEGAERMKEKTLWRVADDAIAVRATDLLGNSCRFRQKKSPARWPGAKV